MVGSENSLPFTDTPYQTITKTLTKTIVMKKKVTIIIEKASDGGYCAYMEEIFKDFGLAGAGDTVEEAKHDIIEAYHETKELLEAEGKRVPELDFVFKYDMQSFFNYFDYLNISKVAEKAGINSSLLRQYSCGSAKAGQKQYEKLSFAINEIKNDLIHATL